MSKCNPNSLHHSTFDIKNTLFGLKIKFHIDLYLSGTLSGCNLPESRKASQRIGAPPAHDIEGIDKISTQSELDPLGDSNSL